LLSLYHSAEKYTCCCAKLPHGPVNMAVLNFQTRMRDQLKAGRGLFKSVI